MKISNYIFLLIFLFIFACENEVKIDLIEVESKMVVEGWIEQGKGPKILLSMSAPYFADIDSSTLRQYAVTGAKVTVTSEDTSEVLTLKPNSSYFPPYYYYGTVIKGKLKQEYSIEIRYKGYIYTAITTIPDLVQTDSVWFDKANLSDTLGLIVVKFKDNPDVRNYYRTLTRRLGKDTKFIPTFTSVFSDESFNGETLEIPLSKGNSSLLDIENSRYFEVGDTIVLKFCSIDKQHYDFWNTIQGQIQTSANPFAISNTEIKSNIDYGLGIWGGYAASYDTIIAK